MYALIEEWIGLTKSFLDLSENDVKKRLAEAEADFVQKGGHYPHSTTASVFISTGLDIEEAQ